MKISQFAAVAVLSVFSGCGALLGGDYSCDLRPADAQCTDWRGLVGPAVTQEAVCATLNSAGAGGKWTANAKCPATDSVGGCQTDSGVGKQTNWFYPPKTEAEVRKECMDDGTTFVSP
ncbi:MAG: hypothetical protein Q8N23_29625 [Archangium sp.]|nr:hypothetical protein [Archangium sp.]MDP3156867.1 hypothetical protein [Archangium sp.]MDP3575544.1 hypothetical protein [Archangium sp.]